MRKRQKINSGFIIKLYMYDAELGDDVYEDDPTVNKLQELAAEKTGKEAALLVSY